MGRFLSHLGSSATLTERRFCLHFLILLISSFTRRTAVSVELFERWTTFFRHLNNLFSMLGVIAMATTCHCPKLLESQSGEFQSSFCKQPFVHRVEVVIVLAVGQRIYKLHVLFVRRFRLEIEFDDDPNPRSLFCLPRRDDIERQ